MLGHTHPFHNILYSLASTAKRTIAPSKANGALQAKKQEPLWRRHVSLMHLRPCSIVVLRLPPCTGNTLLTHPLGQQGLASSDCSEETAASGITSSGEGKERRQSTQISSMKEGGKANMAWWEKKLQDVISLSRKPGERKESSLMVSLSAPSLKWENWRNVLVTTGSSARQMWPGWNIP